MMELRQLRYFIAVAEELSFSRAVEKLHVSQPPLSRQIRDLEAELGVKLLDRNRQGVRLTRLGKGILAKARGLIRDTDLFKAQARGLDKEFREEIRRSGPSRGGGGEIAAKKRKDSRRRQ
jgi:DNA-binding transcriptional LysR family regulator